MTDLLELIKQFSELLVLLGFGVGGAGVSFAGFKISNRMSALDKHQNEQIKELKEAVDTIIADNKGFAKERKFKALLSKRIQGSIDALLSANPNLENQYSSMFIEGGTNAYVFFLSINKHGYQNINMNAMDKRAIQVFRYLRAEYGVRNKDTDKQDKINHLLKTRVAYPLIQELLIKLERFRTANYNGSTDDEFLKIADWFVSEVITRSLRYI